MLNLQYRHMLTAGVEQERLWWWRHCPVESPLSLAQLKSLWHRFGKWACVGLLLLAVIGIGFLVDDERRTSRRQADGLSGVARDANFTLSAGPSDSVHYPGNGPFDERLGYHALPALVGRLLQQDFAVSAQARMSPRMLGLGEQGLFVPYREKSQAGLTLRDCRGQPLFAARYPERVYPHFASVPPLLVDALLFIEDRDLLNAQIPALNPAIDWGRFGKAVADQLLHRIDDSHPAAGGSTLATQIEKYRHSPGGRTDNASEKLRQMASASLRAYLDGENTLPRRREIVTDYLNSVPLSAQAGFGEVNGIGDGLWAWYGRDFAELNRLLALPWQDATPAQRESIALAFKQALSLMVAQRRPSHYLAEGEPALRALTDSHLRVMAEAGVVSTALRDTALPLALKLKTRQQAGAAGSFVDRKAVTAARARLHALLAMPRAYDIDRLDLQVDSPLDGELQRAASALLRSLGDPRQAKAAGLYGYHLLRDGDDPSRIVFSFTLFERGEQSNLLRVQTDSVDQPFDLNDGARLDLGSTAKLRTLVSYLELVTELHRRWAGLAKDELAALRISPNDPLSRWARDYLAQAGDKGLSAMLEAAMLRNYSASPAEGFFTGGGLHYFDNFDPDDNGRTMSVREALTRSVNLVFIRLMRDVVRHVMARGEADSAALLDDAADPRRQAYLARFADREGREFTARFFRKYAGKPAAEAEDLLLQGARPTAVRLAAAFYGLEPAAGVEGLARFLARRLPSGEPPQASLQALHDKYGPQRWNLADRGYLAGLHPLELWLVAYLRQHPTASLGELVAASAEQRQQVYQWLFKTRHKGAQDGRIRNLLEVDAFAEIAQSWRRLGYPFESLTPSYASALGASGDRPAALAELMGIIVNRGLRLPVTRIAALQFAGATPYETSLHYAPPPAQRLLDAEVADVLRQTLIGVVEQGTAKRLKGALLRPDGSRVEIGGKTGTGDHRFDTYGRGGKLISSRVVGRSATLVFLIGERYFGTLMAYVHEPYAEKYKFTSALPAQLLKTLAPTLQPLLDGGGCSGGATDGGK